MAKKRPIVNIDNKPEIHLDKELFQNEVLRPVLKMQHEITLKLFLNHITNLSIEWNDLKKSKKTQCVENQLSRNVQLKNLIIGIVVGQFKELEMDNKYKQMLVKGSTYSILIVYVYGLVMYFSKSDSRSGKSIINSILKTL